MIEPIEVVREILGSLSKSLKAADDANEAEYLAAWQKRSRRNCFNCWGPDEQEQRTMDDDCLRLSAKQEAYRTMWQILRGEEQRIVNEHLVMQASPSPTLRGEESGR